MYKLLGYFWALLSSIITINCVPVTPLPDTNTNEYYCLGFLVHAPEIIYDNVNPFDLHSHVIDVVHETPASTSELEDMTKISDHDSADDTNENYIDNSKENEDYSVNEQQANLIADDVEPIKRRRRRRRRRDNTELDQNKSPTSEDVESNTPTVDESIKTDPDTETNEKSSENTETTTTVTSPPPPSSSSTTSPSSPVDDKENQQQQQQEETLPETIKCFEQKRERYNLNKLIHRYNSVLFDLDIFQ